MLRSLIVRILVRSIVMFALASACVAAYLRVHDIREHDNVDEAESASTTTARSAQYISNDSAVHFEKVKEIELSDKQTNISRTDIEIDAFGASYVSVDGSDIAIGDPGRIYSERAPVWTAASGESHLYYAMAHDGRLVVSESYDGGRTFQAERLIANGFRNTTPAIQGNLALLNTENGAKLYNVFMTSRSQIQIAKCSEPCRRFTTRSVIAATDGRTFDHPYPFVAVDRAGGLHVVFSDGRDTFLSSSADDGETWNEAVRVNDRGRDSDESSTSPVVVAGDSGRVGIAWLRADRIEAALSDDAFSTSPPFHAVEATGVANSSTAPSVAMDPWGMMWIAFRSDDRLMVLRQSSGQSLSTGGIWSAVGELRNEDATRRLSVEIRRDLSGQLSYVDEGMKLFLKAHRFKVENRDDGEIGISGSGRLQSGAIVSFTVLAPERTQDEQEISISMNNGYFASGKLTPPKSLEANLHVVAQGGNTLKTPR